MKISQHPICLVKHVEEPKDTLKLEYLQDALLKHLVGQ
jgi:hypothetical protein